MKQFIVRFELSKNDVPFFDVLVLAFDKESAASRATQVFKSVDGILDNIRVWEK